LSAIYAYKVTVYDLVEDFFKNDDI